MWHRQKNSKNWKIYKNRDFNFLTGSARFFDDFEKNIFVATFFIFSKNLQKLIKSDVSDTNGRRESDFHVEISQNYTIRTDFRSTRINFITFFIFFGHGILGRQWLFWPPSKRDFVVKNHYVLNRPLTYSFNTFSSTSIHGSSI